MAVRVNLDLALQVGLDTNLDDLAFDRDLAQLLDTLDHVVVQVRTLAPSETDTEIDLGDVTSPRLVFVEADGDVVVKLGGIGGDALTVSRPASPTNTDDIKAWIAGTVVVPSIHVTNPSATDSVRVRIAIVGDLVT